MGKCWFMSGVALLVLVLVPSRPVRAQVHADIFEPDRGPFSLSVGYQYQSFRLPSAKFHDNGFNTDFGFHIADWITGASLRVAVAAEGTAAVGLGGHTGGINNLEAKSLFLGGGPHVSIESGSRLEPWIHVLPGWEHFRFTQTATLGSNSAFGFMAGGGVDFKITPVFYWRIQGDYIGTHFQSGLQNNYSAGSGLVLYF